jgi:hypothetical protein
MDFWGTGSRGKGEAKGRVNEWGEYDQSTLHPS